jgi:ribosomal-protein-alanine N-acetyltransferase
MIHIHLNIFACKKTTRHVISQIVFFFIIMSPEINMNDVYKIFTAPSDNQNQYRIRPMHETDIDTLISIEQVTWKNDSWGWNNFLEALNDPRYSCWILESNTTDYVVLGYGLQYILNDVAHIANLCIHPNRRGRGLGGILLRHMIDYARQYDASAVELEVHTTNTNAYRLYSNHGFRIFRFLPRYYSEYSDGYLMTLIL